MSFQVTMSFVKQFEATVRLLSQQKGTKLSDAVMQKPITGEEFFVEQLGATNPVELKDRHGDSPIVSTPHHRRRGTIKDFVWGDMIDKEDEVRMLIDPASSYVRNASYGMGRTKDDVIIGALDTVARTGKDGTTTKSLPDDQKIAVDDPTSSDSGLTWEKLLLARTILENNDVDLDDPENQLYLLCTPYDVEALLHQTEVKSADYNTVKALVQGTVDTYMGFKFKRLSKNRILTDSNDDRRVIAWAKSGMVMGIGADVETNITKRADKNFNWYAHMKMTIGAARLEEEKVVQILCKPETYPS